MSQREVISPLDIFYERCATVLPFSPYDVPELGFTVIQHPDVLCPQFSLSGIFTVQNWDLEPGMSVLDVGTGTGIIGAAAIIRADAANVISLDISPVAVECARSTAERNNLSGKMRVVLSDLFDELGDEKADRIIFNPPFWDKPQDPKKLLTSACCDPGRGILNRFLGSLPDRLIHTDSRALIVFSTQDRFPETESIIRGARGLVVRSVKTEERGHTRVLFSLGRE